MALDGVDYWGGRGMWHTAVIFAFAVDGAVAVFWFCGGEGQEGEDGEDGGEEFHFGGWFDMLDLKNRCGDGF
jgi:hypothetical protein